MEPLCAVSWIVSNRKEGGLVRLLGGCLALILAASISAQTEPELKRFDFTNFSFPVDRARLELAPPEHWRWLDSTPPDRAALRNGRYTFDAVKGDPSPPYLSFASVRYGDIDNAAGAEAVVDLRFSTGGTASWHYLYVYGDGGAAQRVPILRGILECGSRGAGGLVTYAIDRGALVVEFFDPSHRFADCCSSRVIRVRYQLHAGKFVQQGAEETLPAPPMER